ncbi:hypothetical protein G1H11_21810 [Phytoactinopolyspora alkaliphila]|uniref:Uncharacterized protein n=1 Tax=Phytoactinopolyspora alkaliphila TaxID=1783498 RepID=A0A6N9YT02_9ACTN|nr:hypothetical protein [Phytoactinopolyspora alkaliphila]NED97939.1 hypothetical protein [Phytoactinopolyspora alkaliphila]
MLKTWKCDICGEATESVEDAYAYWRDDVQGREVDFKIAHKMRCDPGPEFVNCMDIDEFLGDDGLTRLLAMLSAGPLKGPQGGEVHVADLNEFVDFVRRLHTPGYEEARPHFRSHEVQEAYCDTDEVFPYLQENLEQIAKS